MVNLFDPIARKHCPDAAGLERLVFRYQEGPLSSALGHFIGNWLHPSTDDLEFVAVSSPELKRLARIPVTRTPVAGDPDRRPRTCVRPHCPEVKGSAFPTGGNAVLLSALTAHTLVRPYRGVNSPVCLMLDHFPTVGAYVQEVSPPTAPRLEPGTYGLKWTAVITYRSVIELWDPHGRERGYVDHPGMFRILPWRYVKLVDMETGSARRILAVKPSGPWLVLVNGTIWNVESRAEGVNRPFAWSRIGLLPLLERPREEVERQARQALGPDDPDLAEVLHAIIQCALAGPSEYWTSRALPWMITDEVGLFAKLLREIAVGRSSTQATRHAAKRLLKQNGHWPTVWRR